MLMGHIYSAPTPVSSPISLLLSKTVPGLRDLRSAPPTPRVGRRDLNASGGPIYECSTLIPREHLAIGRQTKSAVL